MAAIIAFSGRKLTGNFNYMAMRKWLGAIVP
jgi:hypothetical protein